MHFEGNIFRFYRKGREFWVSMPDPDPVSLSLSPTGQSPIVNRRVVLSMGSHHIQIYWVTGGDRI